MLNLSYWFVVAAPLALFCLVLILNRLMNGLNRLLDGEFVILHSASIMIERSASAVSSAVEEAKPSSVPERALTA
jgi:hypothetical protein